MLWGLNESIRENCSAMGSECEKGVRCYTVACGIYGTVLNMGFGLCDLLRCRGYMMQSSHRHLRHTCYTEGTALFIGMSIKLCHVHLLGSSCKHKGDLAMAVITPWSLFQPLWLTHRIDSLGVDTNIPLFPGAQEDHTSHPHFVRYLLPFTQGFTFRGLR